MKSQVETLAAACRGESSKRRGGHQVSPPALPIHTNAYTPRRHPSPLPPSSKHTNGVHAHRDVFAFAHSTRGDENVSGSAAARTFPNSPAAHNKLLFCSPEPRSTGSIIVFIRGHASVPIPPVRDECAQMRSSRGALKLIIRCSCQLPCSPHKAHLISFLQAKVFDVLVPAWNKKKKNGGRKKSGIFSACVPLRDCHL